MPRPNLSRVPARLLAWTITWTAGVVTLAWFYLSALIPIDWPGRWLVILAAPVAVSLALSKASGSRFPLADGRCCAG